MLQGPGLLPRLKDAAAIFPFTGSTSSKAEHVSQRNAQEDIDMAGHMHCHRKGVAFNSTHIWDSHKHKPNPLLLIG